VKVSRDGSLLAVSVLKARSIATVEIHNGIRIIAASKEIQHLHGLSLESPIVSETFVQLHRSNLVLKM
jgi:hypothetical protein